MLVFENDIVKVIRHDQLYVASPSHTVLSIDEIVKKVEQTLPSDVKVTDVTLFSDPELACKVSLSKPNKAVMYVDQYTGQLKGMYERPAFFDTMQRLHRWLLDSPGNGGTFWGRIIVGTSTIIFVLVLLSGIIIWWPRTMRILRNSLKIKVSKGRHLLWRSLHIAGGMYALLLLVMALTGLTWSFSWYSKGFYALFGANKTEKNTTPTTDKTATARNEKGSTEATNAQTVTAHTKWQAVYETLRAKNAGYSQITVSDGTASVAFGGGGNQRTADKYTFNPSTGRITSAALYANGDNSSKIRGWILSVHSGSWGGQLTRILWFIAALLGATLPLTGYYLWIHRLRRRLH